MCYQLPSLVLEGLTIVISPLLSSITDQITNLPKCLPGAVLSSFTSSNQKAEIFDSIKSNKLKIVFITPEKFLFEKLHEFGIISLICIDEASFSSIYSQNFRASYLSVVNTIKTKLEGTTTLLISNYCASSVQEDLQELYNISEVVKTKIELPEHIKISVTKGDNKFTNLLKLLRNQLNTTVSTINSLKQSTIIYCNSKRTVDKVTTYLNQNGVSASSYYGSKTESERQQIQQNFNNDKIRIIVATVSFSYGISKKDIRSIIIFDIPLNMDIFLTQIGRCGRDKNESYAHIFLNDEDYFLQRNIIYSDNLDKSQILKFLEYILNSVNTTSNKIIGNKRTFTESLIDSNDNKMINSQHSVKNSSNNVFPKMIAVNFNKVTELLGIKKQAQLYLLNSLISNLKLDDLKINSNGIGPLSISIRFYKKQKEKLAEEEPYFKTILELARDYQGQLKFSTLDVIEKLKITQNDLYNYLFQLQSKGEISYEAKDEGMFLFIDNIPPSLRDVLQLLYDKNQSLVSNNLKKVKIALILFIFYFSQLNAMYILLRKFAAVSLDSFLKDSKNSIKGIKSISLFSDYSTYLNQFRSLFNSYFTYPEGNF